MYAGVGRQTDAAGPADRYREVVTTATRFHRIREWFAGLNPWLVDGGIAILFVVIGLATTSGRGQVSKDVYEPQDALGVFLVLAATVPFVFRRRAPFAVLLFCTAAVVINSSLGHNEGATPFFLWVAVITVAATCTTRKVWVSAAAIFAGLLFLVLSGGSELDAGGFVLNCALFAAMFMFGINLKNRRERIEALEERADALEREKEEEARRAVADERLHIARELHDVVADSMGVIAVQASVGEHVIDANPQEAKRALEAISGVSRSTLAEIRRMLGVLRETDAAEGGALAYAPAPGLGELDHLVHELNGAGIPVQVSYDGDPVGLPRGVDLTVYRIVQEALTNVLKHAGPATRDGRRALRARRARAGDRRRRPRRQRTHRGRPRPRAARDARAGRGLRRNARDGTPDRWRVSGRGAPALRGVGMIRVAVADDQALVRSGFVVLLGSDAEIEVAGEAANGVEAVALVVRERPDVVLMDIRMPEMDGLEATRRIVATTATASTRVLILTTFDHDEYVFEALRAGASGFLLKDTLPVDLLAAIRVVAGGEALLAPSVTRRLIEQFTSTSGAGAAAPVPEVHPGIADLTEREVEILLAVASGMSNAEIAETMFISHATAKTHVSRLLTKLAARDRAQLVMIAYESGVVTPGAGA